MDKALTVGLFSMSSCAVMTAVHGLRTLDGCLLTVKRPLQLLVLQRAGSRQQPVEAVKRRQQVQEVAQQRPRHRHGQQQQRVDDLTQHAASCRHVDHIWKPERREIQAPETETLHNFDGEDIEFAHSPAVMVDKNLISQPHLGASLVCCRSKNSLLSALLSVRRCLWREAAAAADVCGVKQHC